MTTPQFRTCPTVWWWWRCCAFFEGAAVDDSTNITATGDKLWIRIRLTVTVEHFAPKAHSLELDPEDAFSRCNDATTVTPRYRTQTLIIRYKCHRIGWYRHTGSVQCSSILVKSIRILTGILQLFPNTSWLPRSLRVAFSLYSLLLKFTMRFIQFVVACATLKLFNIYAYAKPVPD